MVGSTISHYRVVSKLGEGGMGVVYKAEDTKLERTVALKFLATHLLNDEEAKERFLREAKAAAALHHPNICPVHEIDEADGKTFISMAFIEGESLEDRISAGPLAIRDVLDIGRQVAEGLEAAHEKGVVHRDIKPANIMVDAKGRATIMDFGLARLSEASILTRGDQTLGTAAYMSPEQLQATDVDHRTDVWALGCVLYEMVAGMRAFRGEYRQALAYEIVSEEPEPLTGVRSGVPMELELFVGKCLAKDAADRYQHANEIAVDLRTLTEKLKSGRSAVMRTALSSGGAAASAQTANALDTLPSAAAPDAILVQRRSLRALQTLLGITALTLVGALAAYLTQPEPERTVRRFSFTPESFSSPTYEGVRRAAISPDGRWIAFLSGDDQGGADDSSQLWLRPIDREQAQRLEGSEGAQGGIFWSPDSRFIGFASDRQLKKIEIAGGAPITLCQIGSGVFAGGDWSTDGETIVFSSGPSQGGGPLLYQVPARGGEAQALDRIVGEKGQANHVPSFLPGRVPALVGAVGSRTSRDIYLRNLESGEAVRLAEGSNPLYSPSGHILYQTAPLKGGLWALPFSLDKLEATGEAFPVAQGVGYASLADDGTLLTADIVTSTVQRLAWWDRQGRKVGEIGQPQPYISRPALSPDGRRVAVSAGEDNDNGEDIWLHEIGRPLKQRLTFDEARDLHPSWSADGNEVLFRSGRQGSGDLFARAAAGSGEARLVVGSPQRESFGDWSPDGRRLIYNQTDPETGEDLWLVSLGPGGEPGEPKSFLATPFNESDAQVSPDGRYVAYASSESGEAQVFVREFPEGDGRWQASTNGGTNPRWSRDGKELFYPEGLTLMAVEVSSSPSSFAIGEVKRLFTSPNLGAGYDVAADGRFVVVEDALLEGEQARSPAIRITQNWYEEFRERARK